MGGHAPHGQHNTSDARFVACPGTAEGRNEAERPPALRAPPRPHSRRKRRTPPSPARPQHKNAMDPPRGAQPPQGQSRAPTPARPRPQRGPRQPQGTGSRGRRSARPQTPHATVEGTPPGTPYRRPHNPKPSRGEPGPDRPPPKHARRSKGPGQDMLRGTDHVERPYQRSVPGPREMRAPHHPAGGGADTARARAHTHKRDTRGLPEGKPDRARGTHRPHGMAYQRARVRDTRTGRPATRSAEHAGRGGGNERDTTPGAGPNPPEPAASAAHTQTGHCARQGSSGAQRHAPTPRLGSHRASPRGSHWRQASSTGPAAPAPRATTH